MKTENKELEKIKKKILPLLKKNKVSRAGIFGSYARGEAKKKSDVDILIEISGEKSLFDLIRLEMELKKVLGKKIDLLTYGSIHPLLKKIILDEEVRII
ncbi:MAG: nucleotidyltransferase family protein [Nanoarchaeota archaeon]